MLVVRPHVFMLWARKLIVVASLWLGAGPEKVELFGYLTVDVWDSNVQDTFVGKVMIPIRDIPAQQKRYSTWYCLRRSVAKEVVTGKILLATYVELSDGTEVYTCMLL